MTVRSAGKGGGGKAVSVLYDNNTSGLTAINVQTAVDEIVALYGIEAVVKAASQVGYDGSASGLVALNTQDAIDELAALVTV